ncbi:hypothetical protein ABXJ76_07965 [Methylobacter sp. G7]|uniref:hypothetical protein n=1 Tax=Methylobacter sp. G7 TaxID=3230117 RepID=UPI003D809DA7
MSFFMTEDPAVLVAINQYYDEVNSLKDAANAFKTLLSAYKSLVYSDSRSAEFGGLIFNPPKDNCFWTKPNRNDRSQQPRNKVTKMTAEEKQSHKKLLEQWASEYPKMRPNKDEFYKSIGTNWGNIFLNGIGFFIHNESVYIHTDASLGENVTEILGSVFEAAKADFLKANKTEVQS